MNHNSTCVRLTPERVRRMVFNLARQFPGSQDSKPTVWQLGLNDLRAAPPFSRLSLAGNSALIGHAFSHGCYTLSRLYLPPTKTQLTCPQVKMSFSFPVKIKMLPPLPWLRPAAWSPGAPCPVIPPVSFPTCPLLLDRTMSSHSPIPEGEPCTLIVQ